MKRFYLPITALIGTVLLLSFINRSENRSAFACQWFIYDNPNDGVGDFDDYPHNLAEATYVNNYRIASVEEVYVLCYQVVKICAICAEVDATGKPIFIPGNTIVNELVKYFSKPECPSNVPNPALIKEKFTCP